ncbi:MAG TPA: DUF4922 domain-containing protein [Bacteroidales bacterium]|nr:DUF4922 domain-containing protein [Bacteroidales bacterium]
MGYSESVNNLFISQLSDWDLASANYKQLENVRVRKINFGAFDLIVQFNPGRITSSAAKVDTRSIEARPCFLCAGNRPPQQRGLLFDTNCTILVNPFPIFNRHLTIVSDDHTDQRILNSFRKMLALAKELTDFVIFYNGPQCGASAPDHLHFQAGNKGFLPVENDFAGKKNCSLVSQKEDIKMWQWNNYLRGIASLEGFVAEKLASSFERFYSRFLLLQPDRPEPMLNILCSFSDGKWVIHIIPRKLHRPSQFFAEDKTKIILSPASVDMGGVVITPREEDFNKITASDISDIFGQVCLSDEELSPLIKDIL